VGFGHVPDGLSGAETESFLRKRGAEICFPRRAKNHAAVGEKSRGKLEARFEHENDQR